MRGHDYKIDVKDRTGKPTSRYISAASYFAAREKARALAKQQGWTITSIHKKKNFFYRVHRGATVLEGTQSAYTREEVLEALKRLGGEKINVRREFEVNSRASMGELVSFISTSAKLLEQKMPFHEILQIMSNNIKDKNLKRALRDIIKDLKDGMDSRDAFLRQSPVFGDDTALMLGLASRSGNMKSIFESVARFVERLADFKKALASSLILPAVTSLALVGALVFYVLVLLPDMAETLAPVASGGLPPLTQMTIDFSEFVKANFILLAFALTAPVVAFYIYIMTPKGRVVFDRFVVKIPYVGTILRNTSVEMFCRVLGIMYTSSGENIDAIQYAAESSRNQYLEHQIKNVAIPTMLKYGTELPKALEWTTFFPEMAISRFKTASETGTVKETAVQLADFYEMENRYALKNLTNMIELGISGMIMFVMIFLTYLSSETASIKIDTTPR
ncbi:MAG: type II secretion system F family protein [Ignavibacteriae bacterium]|nr:type II secretion system F family protein [Ignavibacteriota bacterium]